MRKKLNYASLHFDAPVVNKDMGKVRQRRLSKLIPRSYLAKTIRFKRDDWSDLWSESCTVVTASHGHTFFSSFENHGGRLEYIEYDPDPVEDPDSDEDEDLNSREVKVWTMIVFRDA